MSQRIRDVRTFGVHNNEISLARLLQKPRFFRYAEALLRNFVLLFLLAAQLLSETTHVLGFPLQYGHDHDELILRHCALHEFHIIFALLNSLGNASVTQVTFIGPYSCFHRFLTKNSFSLESIFAELGSKTRLSILRELSEGPKRFNQLKRDAKLSSPELVRQLARLRATNLIRRERTGYGLSHFGQLLLSSSGNLDFVIRFSGYFRNHDPSPFPDFAFRQLTSSMGIEIVEEKFGPLSLVMERGNLIREYYWIMSDSIPRFVLPQVRMKIKEGVKFRAIYPKTYLEKVYPTLDSEITRNASMKVVDSVRAVLCVTDQFAYFCLPRYREREIDRTSFMFGQNPRFREWCGALFEYFWKRSVPR